MGFMAYVMYRLFAGTRGALAAALLPLAAAAEPLACDQPAFLFGTVDAATGIVTHAFELRNPGAQPLVLDEVAAPCGCITLKLQTNLLAAGESTRLPVTLDLRRRSGAQRLAAHVIYHQQGQDIPLILKLSMLGTVTGTVTGASPAPDAAAVSAARFTGRPPDVAGGRPVTVELFGEAGCEACATVRREVLPAARELLGGRGIIIERDVYETTNFVVLAAYQ